MPTINRSINDVPFDLKLTAGQPQDLVFRCIGTEDIAVSFKVGANPIGTVTVFLGNTGDLTIDVTDAVASAAMSPIATVRLYERDDNACEFVSFRLLSLLGTTVHITSNGT